MINIDNFKNQVNCLMNIGILEHFTNYKLFCEMFFTSLSQDIFRKLHVSGTASYKITLVHLCICQSVCLSLSFFKIGSLVFSNIVHVIADQDIHWLTEPDFWTKKIWQPEFVPNGSKSGPKLSFWTFSEVWFISFPWNCIQW